MLEIQRSLVIKKWKFQRKRGGFGEVGEKWGFSKGEEVPSCKGINDQVEKLS